MKSIYITGYSPYPKRPRDKRLPHEAAKTDKAIAKTALGAERTIDWEQAAALAPVIEKLKMDGFKVYGLEQSPAAISLSTFQPPQKLALIVGNEVDGIEPGALNLCHGILEIPMLGQKESFNVAQAAAMALYHCRHR